MTVSVPKLDKRHHVPAALIGHFSAHPDLARLRVSRIAVHRFKPPKTLISTAENVGYARYLYRGSMVPGLDNDSYFASFENHALQPVDQVMASTSGQVPADEWVKVAAYVTSQFTRNPDLERSLDELAQSGSWPREQMDVGYVLNTQRVSSAVLRARWEFVRTTKDLILNDRALAPIQYGDWEMPGYFVPLRKNFGVRIAGGPYKKRLAWTGTEWLIDIPIVGISDEQADTLNRWTWCSAVNEVYGQTVEQLTRIEADTPQMMEDLPNLAAHIGGADLLTLSAAQRREDEMLLMNLSGGIRTPPDGDDPPLLTI